MRPILLVSAGIVLMAAAFVVLVSPGVGGHTPNVASPPADLIPPGPLWTSSSAPGGGGPPATGPVVSYPEQGDGRYDVVPATGSVIGVAGTLMRFQVAIEHAIVNLDGPAVASFVENTYADPRGWASGGRWRFQRVGPGQPHDFVVYLVTPGTRDAVCGGSSDRYTNCRNGARVVINIDRWVHAVPNYGAPAEVYRQYAINHETGHRLGDGHELCPGTGQPAPVMQQQTLGLHGCVANAWPYLNGQRYRGTSGAYADPVPG